MTRKVDRPHLRTGTQGMARPAAKLTDAEVVRIREQYAAGTANQRRLGLYYGVTCSVVGHIVRGESWTHVGGPVTHAGRGAQDRG
jgi:hypothetical protein